MKKEQKQTVVFWISLLATLGAISALIALSAAQIYIRWTLNQDFTFLGEAGIPALVVMTTVLTASLAYIHRSER